MTFTIDTKGSAQLAAFMAEQEKVTEGEYGTIGGGYTYSFTPTSIGVIVKVRNTVTKAEIDLSDYDTW